MRFIESARGVPRLACVLGRDLALSGAEKKRGLALIRLSPRPGLLLSFALSALLLAPTGVHAQTFDDLNGVWTITIDGKAVTGTALTESYSEIGFRIRVPGGAPVVLSRTGDTLWKRKSTGTTQTNVLENGKPVPVDADVRLDMKGFDTKLQADDSLQGKWYGKTAVFKRDVSNKPPIVLRLTGDRPYTAFLREVLIPKTAEDRETYHRFDKYEGSRFLKSCQLYKSSYWIYTYLKSKASFDYLIYDMDGVSVAPRTILSSKFSYALNKQLSTKGLSKAGLAMSSLGMYFSTAAGGSVRIPVATGATIYYITDRRASSTNGLVVMETPDHPPLASSFGKWQQAFSAMPITDDTSFARGLLETMVRSDTSACEKLSGVGKSAFTDYLGVMMIEDQRGVMFEGFGQWGYNMTSGSFCALLARALSHGMTRDGPSHVGGVAPDGHDVTPKKELATQVIVSDWDSLTPELRPGDITYFDTLNGADDILTTSGKRGGDDFSEGEGMTLLMELTTQWLREKYPAQLTRVRDSLKKVVPATENGSSDIKNIDNVFHFICDNFYDEKLRMKNLTATEGRAVVDACMEMMGTIYKESRDLEKFILAHGVKKSTQWAPRASGY